MARPVCASACSGVGAPAFNNDFCSTYLFDSTIDKIYVSDTPMTDWTDAAEWTASLDQAGGTGKIVELAVECTMGAPDQEFLEGQNGIKKGLEKQFTIDGYSSIMTTENHAAWRAIECGNSYYLIAYTLKKSNQFQFGYSEQDVQISLTPALSHEGGTNPTKWLITGTWEDNVSPEYITKVF